MADCPLPLVMYGTGDGADRICDMLNRFGREPTPFSHRKNGVETGTYFRAKPSRLK